MRINLFYYILFLSGIALSTKQVGAQCTLAIDAVQETNAISCNGNCDGEITASHSGASGNITFQWFDANNNDLNINNSIAPGLCAGSYTVTITDGNNCVETSTFTLTEPDAISYTATRTNVTCGDNSGELVITGTGGCASNLQYSLDGGTPQASGTFSNLAQGFYSITIADTCNCSATFTEYIATTDGPVISNITPVNPTCFESDNGSIDITATGSGTLMYSIDGGVILNSNNVITNLPPNTYEIVVRDDSGCETYDVVILTEPELITATVDVIDETCVLNNGSIVIHASGGTGAYSFSLDAGAFQPDSSFTSLAGGLHNYTIEDANLCQVSTGQITLISGDGPTITNLITNDPTCSDICDGSVLVAATGKDPLTYELDGTPQSSPSFTEICTGSHTLQIVDADGCVTEQLFTMSAITAPVAAFTVSDTVGTPPLDVTFTNSSQDALSYSWDFGDNLSTSTDSLPTFTYADTGTFVITFVAANGVCADTAYATIILDEGDPQFTMPNIFTPNNDGVNDVFRPIMVGIETIEGGVFNRWGQKIYEWYGNNSYWDGYTHPAGQLAPEGPYFFIVTAVDVNGVTYEEQGVVYLKR